jgi:5-methylcytosine-specific restriction endonuclease McrA
VKRPCITCGELIDAGSYCSQHRWPSSPGRLRGRAGVELRERVKRIHGHRCRHCGVTGVPLEVHHRNGDHTDNRLANLLPLCRPCHARAGMRLYSSSSGRLRSTA